MNDEDEALPPPKTLQDIAVDKVRPCGITQAGQLRCWGVKDRLLVTFSSPTTNEHDTYVRVSQSGLCAIRQDDALRCAGAISEALLEVRTNP